MDEDERWRNSIPVQFRLDPLAIQSRYLPAPLSVGHIYYFSFPTLISCYCCFESMSLVLKLKIPFSSYLLMYITPIHKHFSRYIKTLTPESIWFSFQNSPVEWFVRSQRSFHHGQSSTILFLIGTFQLGFSSINTL